DRPRHAENRRQQVWDNQPAKILVGGNRHHGGEYRQSDGVGLEKHATADGGLSCPPSCGGLVKEGITRSPRARGSAEDCGAFGRVRKNWRGGNSKMARDPEPAAFLAPLQSGAVRPPAMTI